MMDPDSLSASILKSVYLVANVGNRSSQIWRAVIEGRDALNLGVTKRIGNGSATNIWQENWTPFSLYKFSGG
jgi:hypothetical protein